MELKQAIAERRSVRSYTDRTLTRAEIEEILRAGISAPSACNMQSWHFYVVTGDERAKLSGVCADWIATAPVVIIVCTDKDAIEARFGERARKFPVQDTALAMENMLLCATGMGLGGCIIGAYKQEECVQAFNIPESHHVVALLPIGEPTLEIPARERKPLSDVVTFIGDLPCEDSDSAEGVNDSKPFELCRASLPGSVFDDLNLSDAVFNNIRLTDSKFTDINMKNSSFAGLTLEGARFGCVDMQNAHFENVDFTGAEFKNCKFDGAVRIDDN